MFGFGKKTSPAKKVAHRDYGVNSHNRVKKRGFEAAETTLINGWETSSTNINSYIRNQSKTLVARSREQARNNEYARRFISLSKSNVIGPHGVKLQAQSTDARGDLDHAANKAVEDAFWEWSRKFCCIDGQHSWLEIQNLVLSSMIVDGEAFVEIHEGRSFGKYLFQLRLIDSQLIDSGMNHITRSGNQVRMGIEYDSDNRVLAYHLRKTDINGQYINGNYRRVKATNMIHVFRSDWVGQERGIPWMVAALHRLKMLHGYDEAALVAARAGASKMGFYKPDETAQDEGFGDSQDDDGDPIDEARPGVMEVLPKGWDFMPYDPNYPHEQYPHFIKSCLRGVSSGLDISYNTLANDLEDVNYSSIRAGVLEDRELWMTVQEMLIQQLHAKISDRWFDVSYMGGVIKIGSVPLSRGFEYYKRFRFQPRRWSWVDPLKDMNAAEKAILLRTKSISSYIRESGGDPDETFREIAAEQKILKELDIDIEQDKDNIGRLLSNGIMNKLNNEVSEDA